MKVRLWSLAVLLLVSFGVSVTTASTASAAINNCPWVTASCSSYTSREEARALYQASRGPVGKVDGTLCEHIFPLQTWTSKTPKAEKERRQGTNAVRGDCKQMTIFVRDVDSLSRAIEGAYAQNACVEFKSKLNKKWGALVVSEVKVYSGSKFCK